MIFNELLKKYDISEDQIVTNGDKVIITKMNWDYPHALEFQYEVNNYVYENPDKQIYILTSHPNVLTMGRGLQRDQVDKYQLVKFDSSTEENLPVSVYQVRRGGGMTFHHPGQIVVYPIVHIAHQKIKTIELINYIFEVAKESIESSCELKGLDYHRDLLGLWYENHKLASMGIQLKKFVSLHGLALNVERDEVMSEVLKTIFPCGIDGNTYRSLNELTEISKDELLKQFQEKLLI